MLKKAEILKIIRFGIVGVGATLTHITCVVLLSIMTAFHPVIINTIAFCVAFTVSGVGHTFFTFRLADNQRAAITKFFFVALFALALSNGGLYIMVEGLNIKVNISKAIAIFIVPCVSYILARLWAFKATEN